MYALAVIMPWIVFIVYSRWFSAFAAIILQCTGIGWIGATIWAFMAITDERTRTQKNDSLRQEAVRMTYINQSQAGSEPIISVIDKTDHVSSTDRLLKLKKLLDNGAITQEEFEEKKSQILANM